MGWERWCTCLARQRLGTLASSSMLVAMVTTGALPPQVAAATRRAVVPVSVRTTIIEAPISMAVLTAEEATASQDGSAAAVAPAAPPPSKWARAGIEARRQSAVQRAQNAEISTFGKGALKKSKSRRGLPMGVSALVEDEEEQVDAQPMSPQARVTRL